jgi:hypothetical protein
VTTMPMLSETDLLHCLIERVPFVLPHVRVFRRNVINRTVSEGDRKYTLKNGIAGQSDAYALVLGGRHVEIETKAARGVMREAQERWRAYCLAFQIPHIVLRAKKDEAPVVTVERWVNELSEVVNG